MPSPPGDLVKETYAACYVGITPIVAIDLPLNAPEER